MEEKALPCSREAHPLPMRVKIDLFFIAPKNTINNTTKNEIMNNG
jgi:hypothetical protein